MTDVAIADPELHTGEASVESAKLLSEIRDSLLRIEKRLGDGGGG